MADYKLLIWNLCLQSNKEEPFDLASVGFEQCGCTPPPHTHTCARMISYNYLFIYLKTVSSPPSYIEYMEYMLQRSLENVYPNDDNVIVLIFVKCFWVWNGVHSAS
jgi:hypothetical protein